MRQGKVTYSANPHSFTRAFERMSNNPQHAARTCHFCEIIKNDSFAYIVNSNEHAIAFLDIRPLFPGHCLVAPRLHVRTFDALPLDLLTPFCREIQRLSTAIERAMNAAGSFIAVNNRVSQSVPHLHVHIVPRRPGDGLRGFFWPRQKYRDESHAQQVRAAIAAALTKQD